MRFNFGELTPKILQNNFIKQVKSDLSEEIESILPENQRELAFAAYLHLLNKGKSRLSVDESKLFGELSLKFEQLFHLYKEVALVTQDEIKSQDDLKVKLNAWKLYKETRKIGKN